MSLPAAINQSYPGWISRVDRIIRSCIGKDHNQLSFPFKDFYECAFSPEAVCLLALKYCEDKEMVYQNFPLWMRETRKYLQLFGNNCEHATNFQEVLDEFLYKLYLQGLSPLLVAESILTQQGLLPEGRIGRPITISQHREGIGFSAMSCSPPQI